MTQEATLAAAGPTEQDELFAPAQGLGEQQRALQAIARLAAPLRSRHELTLALQFDDASGRLREHVIRMAGGEILRKGLLAVSLAHWLPHFGS